MKKVLLVLLLLCFLVVPSGAWPGDAHYTWPVFWGTDNGGPDNGYMTFYNQGASAFTARKLIANDLLNAQWTPQRQGIGWDTNGRWTVSFIADTGAAPPFTNTLEIWGSQGTQWIDAGGAYLRLDGNNSGDWLAVDVETRQDYVWAMCRTTANYACYNIDLSGGVPAWVFNYTNALSGPTNNYSIVLDDNLCGSVHQAFIYNNGLAYVEVVIDESTSSGIDIDPDNAHPQIIVDGEERLWIFVTENNGLFKWTRPSTPANGAWWGDSTAVHAANTLANDYHVTWYKATDDIHVVLVDYDDDILNNTHLIYLRRTPNGWSAPVTLLTVDSGPFGDEENMTFPQITCDPWGALMIYYIYEDVVVPGDLQAFYLDSGFYADFDVPANWVRHTDIDGDTDSVLWCVAPDSIIISGDM